MGANGAGKSNFISFFKFLNQVVAENLQVYVGASGGANQFLYYGQKTTIEIHFYLEFGMNYYSCTIIPTAGDSFIFKDEIIYFHDKHRYSNTIEIPLGTGHGETLLNKSKETIADYIKEAINDWRIYHFHDTSESAMVKKIGDLNDNLFFRADASNLAAFLYSLKKQYASYYEKIRDTIQLVAPFFDDFILRPSPLNTDKIRLKWKEKSSDTYFDANMLSDGTLRFICLATLLLQPDDFIPSIIIIDEPELGLHHYAISLFADMLENASEKTQVIVSTQSVTLVNQFSPENIVVVDRVDGQTILKKLSLEDYAPGELWEKNVFGGRP